MKQQAPSAPIYPQKNPVVLHPDCLMHSSFGCGRLDSFKRFLVLKSNAAVDFTKNIEELVCCTCIISDAVGASLLVSGIGFVAGITLEVVTGVAGLLNIAVSLFHALLHQSRQAHGRSCVGHIEAQYSSQPHFESTGGLSGFR